MRSKATANCASKRIARVPARYMQRSMSMCRFLATRRRSTYCRFDGDGRAPQHRDHGRRAGRHRPRAHCDARRATCAASLSGASRRAGRQGAARRARATHRRARALRQLRSARIRASRWLDRSVEPAARGTRSARPPGSHQCAQRAVDARSGLRRMRDGCVRSARHRPRPEERDAGRRHSILGAHRVFRRTHAHASRRDDAGRLPAHLRCVSRLSRRTCRCATCRPRSPQTPSGRRLQSCAGD